MNHVTTEPATLPIQGLEYARQALQQDMGDGHSWLVLGNAYLAAFFTVEAKMESLKHCKAAYSKAVCWTSCVCLVV